MKSLFLIIYTLLLFSSCNKSKPKTVLSSEVNNNKHHIAIHEKIEKTSIELDKFDTLLVELYNKSRKNPLKAIFTADSLLKLNKVEESHIKKPIKHHIESSLNYLKAEIYYKQGEYSNSIKELNKENYPHGDNACALAANYIKLKQFDKAKILVDNISNYITDYALGNYYESVGNKEDALKIYNTIKQDKNIKHYVYYKLAEYRIDDISRNNHLLNEIYFPTGNPNFEICDTDNENRNKIFDIIFEIPEVKKKNCGLWIYESPQTNNKDYYWVKAGQGAMNETYKTEFNFFVYMKPFEVKIYDEKNKITYSLSEWRKLRK